MAISDWSASKGTVFQGKTEVVLPLTSLSERLACTPKWNRSVGHFWDTSSGRENCWPVRITTIIPSGNTLRNRSSQLPSSRSCSETIITSIQLWSTTFSKKNHDTLADWNCNQPAMSISRLTWWKQGHTPRGDVILVMTCQHIGLCDMTQSTLFIIEYCSLWDFFSPAVNIVLCCIKLY